MPELAFSAYDLAPDEFNRRRTRARSEGCEAWLWPEISIDALQSARETVTRALGEVLTHGHADTPLTGDPDTVSLASFTAGLGPLLGWWIAEGRVTASGEISAIMDLHLRHNRIRMDRMRTRAMGVIQALEQEAAPVTVLKGMHTAFVYFPDPATRPLSDIDLLVDGMDADRANTYFRDNGYRLTNESLRETSWGAPGISGEPRSLMLTHADDPWTIDLHNSLDYELGPSRLTKFDWVTDPRSRPVWSCSAAASVLPQPLLLLHLAAHASASLVNLTPLRMAEAVMVIRRDTALGTLQWQHFIEMGKATGALAIVFPLLHFVEILAPGTVPATVLETSAAASPAGVKLVVKQLTAANVQRISRLSVKELFMWCTDWRDIARRIARDLTPGSAPGPGWSIYQTRAIQVLKGRLQYRAG